MAEAVRLYLAIEPSRASLTVRILRYEIEKGLRAVYIESNLTPLFQPLVPFFERNHSFGVRMVSGNVWKTF